MPIFTEGDIFIGIENGLVQWRDRNGNLIATLDTGNPGTFTTGMGFDAANQLYVTNFDAQTVVKFAPNGTRLGNFGTGYDQNPESIIFDGKGHAYVGQANGSRDVLKFDLAGNLLQSFDVEVQNRGSDWIDLAADQCTLFYTSEGDRVFRYDVCTNTQLPDFATLPHPIGYALRILRDGTLLVANSEEIVRLDSTGNLIQAYDAPNQDNWFALVLDPDGTSFWSADSLTADVFKFDIATGAILLQFNTGTGPDTVFGLGIKHEPTVATSCPLPDAQTCCQVVVESQTDLSPPALRNTTMVTKTVTANVEAVCPGKVIVCGVVSKTISYTLEDGGTTNSIDTETPFQCVIEREDANANDLFEVSGVTILCEGINQERNFGGPLAEETGEPTQAFNLVEKDLVKVCVRRVRL